MSKPLLCVTVTAPTTAKLRQRRDEAAASADLVEVRLDSVSDPSAAGAVAARRGPVIVTCRPTWEGGQFAGSEEERARILSDAVALGAEYVDIEWRARLDQLLSQTGGRRIVLSSHDFDGVPTDLAARVRAMRSTGAEVVKVAVQARQLSDCLPLLDLGGSADPFRGLVAIAMGDAGLATRVLAGRFGSKWTYAGSERQVGQVSAKTLLNGFRFRTLTNETELYGLVGKPVSHSVSPAMHNAAFAAAERDAVYLPFPAASADDFVTFARALGIKGASVTIPYKVDLLERVNEVSPIARRIGAINTINVTGDRWVGGNTDATAFLHPLQHRLALKDARAAVLGAGGSARAVAVALASSGAKGTVHARSRPQAEAVAQLASGEAGGWPPERGSWDLLVNCTPVGMYPRLEETPIDATLLTGQYVYDLVYNPATTRLMREAAQTGCHAIGGLEMLVAQAEAQFEGWTGARPPSHVMHDAAVKQLAEFAIDEHHVV